MESDPESKRLSILDRYFQYMEHRSPSEQALLLLVGIILCTSLVYIGLSYSAQQKQSVPTSGGTFVEGIVGTPRFVNPVLAITRTDQDISALVYSGIMRLTPEGELTNDLASDITISDDGLVYNVTLRDDIYFHDGFPVTADDVAFTIALIQDPMLKSPQRGNWNEVTVEVLGEKELNIILSEAYTPFIENLTVGILPKHVWGNLSTEQLPFSQHNTEPIGSGPYQLEKTTHNSSGLIESYTLSAAQQGELTANISNLVLKFYPNEDTLITAFEEGEFMATTAFSFETLDSIDRDEYRIIEQPLPRVFAVFFNQNHSSTLRDAAVRNALAAAVNRQALVDEVLHGYGVPTDSPVPPGFLDVESLSTSTTPTDDTATTGIRYAESLLIDAGWQQTEDGKWQTEIDDSTVTLSVSITTTNSRIFEETAAFVRAAWEELGVEVSTALFDQSDLVQTGIRPRNYEALLFGTELGRSLDFYPFWHSSQKDDPGLNVSLYTNITTDELLETARTSQDVTERREAIMEFEKEVAAESPAVFLYSPSFTYVIDADISTPSMERVVRPSERFSGVRKWHMNENDVWPFLAQ